jgi:hypothetical protein
MSTAFFTLHLLKSLPLRCINSLGLLELDRKKPILNGGISTPSFRHLIATTASITPDLISEIINCRSSSDVSSKKDLKIMS